MKVILIIQKLLKTLWIKFVKTCVYIWNRVPEVNFQISYEWFEGIKFNIAHLWVLKCKIFVMIPFEYHIDKFAAHSWQGIFVDYNGTNNY